MRVQPRALPCERAFGKVRQIEVSQLWVQDRVARGDIELVKVGTEENIADAMTKYLDRIVLDKHTCKMGLVSETGRHKIAPAL